MQCRSLWDNKFAQATAPVFRGRFSTPIMLTRPLILASASPRRADLLTQIGLTFTTLPSHIDERPADPGEDILAWARESALAKAQATSRLLPVDQSALVLGADTVVILPQTQLAHAPLFHDMPAQVLGKPRDAHEACSMLQLLSHRDHSVLSAFALLTHPDGEASTDTVETRVCFRDLTIHEIESYVASGEPMDKAGAYGIQGRGAVFIREIVGDYFNVVGLPLSRLWERLAPWR